MDAPGWTHRWAASMSSCGTVAPTCRFAPFPAVLFMPLVAITGPDVADHLEPGINADLAALSCGPRMASGDPHRRPEHPRSRLAGPAPRPVDAAPVGDHPWWRLAHGAPGCGWAHDGRPDRAVRPSPPMLIGLLIGAAFPACARTRCLLHPRTSPALPMAPRLIASIAWLFTRPRARYCAPVLRAAPGDHSADSR